MKTNLVFALFLFIATQMNAINLPVTNDANLFEIPTTHTKATKLSKVEKATKLLRGKWVNFNLLCADKRKAKKTDAYLKYQFKKDGTYVKLVGNKAVETLERGFWRISEDGAYILFYVSKDGTAEKIYATQFAKITKLTNNTMKIAYAVYVPLKGDDVNTSYQEFTFDKK